MVSTLEGSWLEDGVRTVGVEFEITFESGGKHSGAGSGSVPNTPQP